MKAAARQIVKDFSDWIGSIDNLDKLFTAYSRGEVTLIDALHVAERQQEINRQRELELYGEQLEL